MRLTISVSSFDDDVDTPHQEDTYEEIETMPEEDGEQCHEDEYGELSKNLYAIFLLEVSLSEELLCIGVKVVIFPGYETSGHHVTEECAPSKGMCADGR